MKTGANQHSLSIGGGFSCLWLFTIMVYELMLVGRINGWTYHHIKENMEWTKARDFCQEHYTDMVAIQNKAENQYLNDFLPFVPSYYWIGIRKVNSVWTWIGTNKTLTKEETNWAPVEPNNKGKNEEDCVEIYVKRKQNPGMWNDISCTRKKNPLCYQASCQNSTCSSHAECVETIGNYTCRCDKGYYGINCEHVVECNDLLAPERVIMDCTDPIGNFRYSSTCDFHCEAGFTLKGKQRAQCAETGLWTEQTPTCEAVKCRDLETSVVGSKKCSDPLGDFSYNSTCDFSCDEGFELRGLRRLECGASGEWTAQTPSCTAVKCSHLETPAQGIMECNHPTGDFSFNSTCDFSCAEGFELLGLKSLECGASGEWTAQTPSCAAVNCSRLEIPAQGIMECNHPTGDFSFNSTCDFSCAEGFELLGLKSLECGASGEWTAQTPSCAAVNCSRLEIPAQGIMECNHPTGDFSFNSTCNFSCAEGFELLGSKSLECGASGEWTAQTPSCAAVRCDAPEIPNSGGMNCSHPNGNFSYSSTCNFGCMDGFWLNGSESLKCDSNGAWTGPAPTCQDSSPKLSIENHIPILLASGGLSLISAVSVIIWIAKQLRKKAKASKFSLLSDTQNKPPGIYKSNSEV
ncbi:E-selectin-like [Callorhinchus milii]|uniref:E-selectin-like n=1 Tax=Callorhinchus milii TaxID=7868 RepID=UPI001C3FA8EA|nr:E-selectin-like [Callorhinchus milii]